MSGGTSRQVNIGAINLPASELDKLVTLQITGLSGYPIAAKTYASYNSGSGACTITAGGSTADLYIGCPVYHSPASGSTVSLGTVSAITGSGSFTVSTLGATLNATGTTYFYFPSHDYMMFTAMKSGQTGFYKVPAGKTFYALNYYPVAVLVNNNNNLTDNGYNSYSASQFTFPGLFGYATAALVAEDNGRLRSHKVPTGAVHYAQTSTDYFNQPNSYRINAATSLTTSIPAFNGMDTIVSFPANSYPFFKTNHIAVPVINNATFLAIGSVIQGVEI